MPCGLSHRSADTSFHKQRSFGFKPLGYVVGLRTSGTLHNLKFHCITLFEGPIAIPDDGRVMNENIGTVIPSDETVPLRVVEPLYSAPH